MTADPVQTTPASIARARALIESRLAELEGEADRLRAALDQLEPKRPRAARARSKRGRSRRAGRGQRQTQFLERLEANPGASIAEHAREMGVRPQQLYAIARRLTESGSIAKRDGTFVRLHKATGAAVDGDQA